MSSEQARTRFPKADAFSVPSRANLALDLMPATCVLRVLPSALPPVWLGRQSSASRPTLLEHHVSLSVAAYLCAGCLQRLPPGVQHYFCWRCRGKDWCVKLPECYPLSGLNVVSAAFQAKVRNEILPSASTADEKTWEEKIKLTREISDVLRRNIVQARKIDDASEEKWRTLCAVQPCTLLS